MTNVYALNRAGANLTPEIYRQMDVSEVMELFEKVEESTRREQEQLEEARSKNNNRE